MNKYPAPKPKYELEPKCIELPMSGQELGELIFIVVVILSLLFN